MGPYIGEKDKLLEIEVVEGIMRKHIG